MLQYVTFKNAELILFIIFTGFSVALHSLWPGVSVVLGMLARQALSDYYSYKQTGAKLIETVQLQAELDLIRQSHVALTNSTETVNTQLKSLQSALSMVGKQYGRG